MQRSLRCLLWLIQSQAGNQAKTVPVTKEQIINARVKIPLQCLTTLLLSLASSVYAQRGDLIAAGAVLQQVASGFAFLESPVQDRQGGLLFTDIDRNRLHRLNSDGSIEVVREPSNHANGLTLDLVGGLLIGEQSAQRITKLNLDNTLSMIADSYNGQPFNSPPRHLGASKREHLFHRPQISLP